MKTTADKPPITAIAELLAFSLLGLVDGRSILAIAPLELADRIGAFLSTIRESRVAVELDECLEPAVAAMRAAGFPPQDVEVWRQVLADRAILASMDGQP